MILYYFLMLDDVREIKNGNKYRLSDITTSILDNAPDDFEEIVVLSPYGEIIAELTPNQIPNKDLPFWRTDGTRICNDNC